MGTLNDFSNYIKSCIATLKTTETNLVKRQEHYETLFQEVQAVREHEFQVAIAQIVQQRGSLPVGLDTAIDKALVEAEKQFNDKLDKLRDIHARILAKAEKHRAASIKLGDDLRAANVDLDAQEEALKVRNEELLRAIANYNDRIKRLGSGFGFFVNVFDMRALRTERLRLDKEQADVAAHIESLRFKWAGSLEQAGQKQAELQTKWLNQKTKADALQAKIGLLLGTKDAVVERTALEQVLFRGGKGHRDQHQSMVTCPRCGGKSGDSNSFCYYCALRLKPDRPDLVGSLPEMEEIEYHYDAFASGMRACQELIALVRGISSGLESFHKSVAGMITTQNTMPVGKLNIDVPDESIAFSNQFSELSNLVKQNAYHPKQLTEAAEYAKTSFSREQLDKYFNRMGDELSRRAKAQW